MADKDIHSRLDAIEQKISHAIHKIEGIEDSQQDFAPDPEASKKMTAVALGLIGAKIGATTGAQIAFVSEAYKKHKVGELGDMVPSLKDIFPEKGVVDFRPIAKVLTNHSGPMVKGTLIGAVAFGVAGAYVGHTRGDRLDRPIDLLLKPIDSINRLASSEEHFRKQHPDHPKYERELQGRVSDAPKQRQT